MHALEVCENLPAERAEEYQGVGISIISASCIPSPLPDWMWGTSQPGSCRASRVFDCICRNHQINISLVKLSACITVINPVDLEHPTTQMEPEREEPGRKRTAGAIRNFIPTQHVPVLFATRACLVGGREERADEGLGLRSRERMRGGRPVYTARRLDTTGYLNGNSLFGLATGTPLGTGSLDDRRREQIYALIQGGKDQ